MAYHQAASSPKFPCFLFLLVITVFCCCFATAKTQKSLKRGSSFSVEDDSGFLTSPDKSFTCGFYGVGTNAYWFSIWFTYSENKTLVWMANRDRPVNALGSRVSLSRDGNMVLTNVDGKIVWESSTNSTPTGAERAELMNSGNLVLKNPLGKILWQSFDFPTDTLLPNQPFTKTMKLTSSLGRGNFGTGYFSFYFDNDNVLRLIYDGPDISRVYWPGPGLSVYQNGRTDYNSSRIAVFDEMGNFVSSDDLIFSASDMGARVITWQALAQQCRVHGICGRNGICVYTPELKCSCLPGYEVVDTSNWNKGCKPKFKPTCSQSQRVKFEQIQYVDFYGFDLNYSESTSIQNCTQLCVEDCRCEAFVYRGQKCYTKGALFSGLRSPTIEGSLYLRLPEPLSMETSPAANLTVFNSCRINAVKLGTSSMYDNPSKRVRWVYLYSFAAAIGAVEFLFILSGWWLLFRRSQGVAAPLGIRHSNRVVENAEEEEAEMKRFVRIAKRKIQCGEDEWIEDMLDPRLEGQFSRNQAAKMVEIGISCVEEDRNKRPTMDSIVQMLLECEEESNIQ
ncbi:hypothetical protein ACE6H2_017443 [Prunus campanulata]